MVKEGPILTTIPAHPEEAPMMRVSYGTQQESKESANSVSLAKGCLLVSLCLCCFPCGGCCCAACQCLVGATSAKSATGGSTSTTPNGNIGGALAAMMTKTCCSSCSSYSTSASHAFFVSDVSAVSSASATSYCCKLGLSVLLLRGLLLPEGASELKSLVLIHLHRAAGGYETVSVGWRGDLQPSVAPEYEFLVDSSPATTMQNLILHLSAEAVQTGGTHSAATGRTGRA